MSKPLATRQGPLFLFTVIPLKDAIIRHSICGHLSLVVHLSFLVHLSLSPCFIAPTSGGCWKLSRFMHCQTRSRRYEFIRLCRDHACPHSIACAFSWVELLLYPIFHQVVLANVGSQLATPRSRWYIDCNALICSCAVIRSGRTIGIRRHQRGGLVGAEVTVGATVAVGALVDVEVVGTVNVFVAAGDAVAGTKVATGVAVGPPQEVNNTVAKTSPAINRFLRFISYSFENHMVIHIHEWPAGVTSLE